MDFIHDLGGVPTEERFQSISQEQWLVLLNHYFDKKARQKEEILGIVEYLALLVSINPKGVQKVIKGRLQQKRMEENSKENPDRYLKVNQDGLNEFGQHINTTFLESLKEFGGDEAIKALGEDVKEYKMDPKADFSDEDDDFLKQAKIVAKEYEDELKNEPPSREYILREGDEPDTIIF